MPDSKVNKPKRLLMTRKRRYRAVVYAIDKYGDRLEANVADPDVGLPRSLRQKPIKAFLRDLRGDLDETRRDLVVSERALGKAERRGKRLARRRDKDANEVSGILVALRGTASHIFVPEELDAMGFAQRTESGPEEILEQGVTVSDALTDPELERPATQHQHLTIDWSESVEKELVPKTDALRQAIDAVAAQDREVVVLRHDRDVALKAFDRSHLWVSRTVESLFQLAGLDDLAAQVRLNERVNTRVVPTPATETPTSPATL
jgi:hypothetical protein